MMRSDKHALFRVSGARASARGSGGGAAARAFCAGEDLHRRENVRSFLALDPLAITIREQWQLRQQRNLR
jgi:hypothetical protein